MDAQCLTEGGMHLLFPSCISANPCITTNASDTHTHTDEHKYMQNVSQHEFCQSFLLCCSLSHPVAHGVNEACFSNESVCLLIYEVTLSITNKAYCFARRIFCFPDPVKIGKSEINAPSLTAHSWSVKDERRKRPEIACLLTKRPATEAFEQHSLCKPPVRE